MSGWHILHTPCQPRHWPHRINQCRGDAGMGLGADFRRPAIEYQMDHQALESRGGVMARFEGDS